MTEGLAITILLTMLALLVLVGIIANAWYARPEPRQHRGLDRLLDR